MTNEIAQAHNGEEQNENGNETTALAVQGEAQSQATLNLRPSEYLPGNRPVTVSSRKIADTFSAVGGARPVFASDVQFKETMQVSGIRPIAASTLAVRDTYNTMGSRPVSASALKVKDTLQASGIRPIAASTLAISETISIMGNRPVAANSDINIDLLMGYLD